MHARFSGWQSLALAVALLASLIGGVMVAQADAERVTGTGVQQVPDVPAVDERASGRAVDGGARAAGGAGAAGDEPVTDAAASPGTAGGGIAIAYTVEQDDRAEIRVTTAADRDSAEDLVAQLSTRPEVVVAEIDAVFAALGDGGVGSGGGGAGEGHDENGGGDGAGEGDGAGAAGEGNGVGAAGGDGENAQGAAAEGNRRGGVDGPERDRQWGLDALSAERAWQEAHACGQTIAVIDSGVHAEHPDLVGTVRPGKDMVRGGYAVRDSSGHGTEVTGVAAAAHGNGRGIAGMAPGVRVLPVAIEDAAGRMHASDLARGIRYAIIQDADVINLSLGGPVRSTNVEYWLEEAHRAGIAVVASAGNAYRNGNPAIWPAASPSTISVAALAPTNVWAAFSSTGDHVDLAAPGVAILTTGADGGYVAGNGTSLAAPFVSATVALLRARDPELGPDEIRQVLVEHARDLGPAGWDPKFGHGLVDPAAALDAIGGTPRKCFTDIGELTLADQIERLAFAGITDGCGERRFCPAQPVTRGQMATFLSRAIGQPPTDADFFTDDDASIHQQGINRLAQANIARGCTTADFCPLRPVTRAQMAAFIARALDLPAAGVDAFEDDDGDIHEPAINALAAADITGGCDAGRPERFCPTATVTRAQMAAFLTRMMDRR